MHKGLVLLAAAAVTGGSYYLISQAKTGVGAVNTTNGASDVEELSAQEDAAVDAEKGYGTSYDGVEASEATAAAALKEADEIATARPGSPDGQAGRDGEEEMAAQESQAMDALTAGRADVETIEDADEAGETVRGPLLIEDRDDKTQVEGVATTPQAAATSRR